MGACCFGNRKCNQDFNSLKFRITNAVNGEDLAFGATKIYNKDIIKFYSLSVTDTIFHKCTAAPNSTPGNDSLLFVDVDYSKQADIFLRLSNTDIDTLKISFDVINASPCCPDYTLAKAIGFNNQPLQTLNGGITIIKK